MMEDFSVSVCMATYNGEKFLKKQLESILCQLSDNDEIIISDDNSTDNTLNIIESFCDSRIKIFKNKKKSFVKNTYYYVTSNFENAIINANGNFIFLADQDDIWCENKVSQCLKHLYHNELVLHDSVIVNEKEEKIKKSYFELNKSAPGLTRNLIKNSYLCCCMAFRKEIIPTVLPFPKEVPHDIWFGLVCEKKFKVKFIDEKLLLYRRHGNNISASEKESKNSLLYKISYRLRILFHLIKA